MKNPLKRCTIAITGDFGPNRTHDKLRQWIENNGGLFVKKVDSEVTHLVCSRDHFRRSVEMVTQARKLKKLKIVSYDWLEDSLMKRSPRKEGEYLMHRKIKAIAKAKAKKKVVRKENLKAGVEAFKAGCDEFKNTLHAGTDDGGYHIYHDCTGFSYDIALVRADLTINKNERYVLKVGHLPPPVYPSYSPRRPRVPLDQPRAQRLQLYETHTNPYSYACFTTYSSPTSNTATHVCAPRGSTFPTAMSSFKAFFELKTKKKWEERLEEIDTGNERAYHYSPPAPGEPVGRFFKDGVYDAVWRDPW